MDLLELIEGLNNVLNSAGNIKVDEALLKSIVSPSSDYFKLMQAFKTKDKKYIKSFLPVEEKICP